MQPRLLDLLRELRSQDPDIEEVGFLFGQDDGPFKLSEHRLAITQECVPQLAYEAKAELRSQTDADELELASMAILLVLPDYFRAWRVRLELFRNGHVSRSFELKVNRLIILRAPKEYEAWAHRRCLLADIAWTPQLRQSELELSTTAANFSRGNYYSWVHRLLVAETMGLSELEAQEVASRDFIRRNIQDSSAWHFRRYVLHRLARTGHDTFASEMQERFGESQSLRNHTKALENMSAEE